MLEAKNKFISDNELLSCLTETLKFLEESSISDNAKNIIDIISVKNSIKKGILMKSLRVAFFGSLTGPDLIQSWVLFSESKSDISRIERCL